MSKNGYMLYTVIIIVMMQPSGERADASVDDGMGRADHNTDYTRQRIRGDDRYSIRRMQEMH